MGSAGTAGGADPSGVWLNPALAARSSGLAAQFVFFEADRVDQRGVMVLVSAAGPLGARYGLAFRQKGVSDLIDDPAFRGAELRVTDNAMGLTFARPLVGERLGLGATFTFAWSSVLGTNGSAPFVDLGVQARPINWLAVGLALRRVGPGFQWETASGKRLQTGLGRAVRWGAAVTDIAIGPVLIAVAGDVEMGSSLGGEELGLGVETALGPGSFRFGMSRPAAARVVWTGGLGLRFHDFTGDLAYEWRDFVGPRLYVGLSYSRSGEDEHED